MKFNTLLSQLLQLLQATQKKKIQKNVRSTRSPRQKRLPRQTKNGDLSIVFSVQGTGGSPMGPDPENRVGYQDTGSPGWPVSSGLQVPGELGHCCARTRPPYQSLFCDFILHSDPEARPCT